MNLLFRYRKPVILIAGVMNILGGAVACISPAFFLGQFFKVAPGSEGTFPYLAMYHFTFWAFVIIMGFAYLMTAIDPDKNRAVLFAGGAGKLVASLFWIMLFAQGHGNWLMITGGITDLLLGVVFLLFLAKKAN